MIYFASYCRVSTDKDDQTNSFEAHQRYFKEYIDRQMDWELYRVYADEGITGTSTEKRAEFNRMINDAKIGKFRPIITKEVSRFSRNILDTIGYTRELKALGVGVLFMNDGISTLEPDAELRLSIMDSIADIRHRSGAGCHLDPSVPKAVRKKHPLLKVSSKVFNLPLFYDKGAIGEQVGYIISFSVASDYHRRIVLPVFENSISISFPDAKFTGFRGYLYVEDDLPGTK